MGFTSARHLLSMDGILAAKYQYVLTHKDRTDLNTYDFLVELKNANYKDAKKIYSSLYTYTFKAWYAYSA